MHYMNKSEILKSVRKSGGAIYSFDSIRNLGWDTPIENSIQLWARDNMMYATIKYESESKTDIREVVFTSSR